MDAMDNSEFRLNIRLVDAGLAPGTDTEECTSDTCGSGNTKSEVCVTDD